MVDEKLISLCEELKILTICINELTVLMNKREKIDRKYTALYNERQPYLCEQILLTNQINLIINNYKNQ